MSPTRPEPRASEPSPREPKAWIIGLAVFVLSLAVYVPALSGPFVWDDHDLIDESSRVTELRPIGEYFGTAFWLREEVEPGGRTYYRPLSIFSLAVDHAIHGNNPAGFHLTNLLVHALNATLLFGLLRGAALGSVLAGALSLFWGWFPRLTEAAAWISGRTDALAASFVLGALLLVRADRSLHRWLAALCLLLGLLCKEVAFAGVLAVATWEWLSVRGAPRRERLLRLLPVASAALVYATLRSWAIGPSVRSSGLSPTERLLAALEALGRYATMIVDAFRPAIQIGHLGEPAYAFVVLGGVVALGSAALLVIRRKHLDVQSITWLVLVGSSLGLVLHLIPITVNVVAADRFLYVPLLGLVLLGAPLMARALRRRGAGFLLGAVLLCFAPVTWARTEVWADEVEFWATAFREQRDHNAMSRLELGNVYSRAGLFPQALSLYLDADDGDYLNYLMALHNLGSTLIDQGEYQKARAVLEGVVERAPNIPKFRLTLAVANSALGRVPEARRELDQALRQYPGFHLARGLRKHLEKRTEAEPLALAPEASPTDALLRRMDTLANSGRFRDMMQVLLAATGRPDFPTDQLDTALVYAFDHGTPRELETIYGRYRSARAGRVAPDVAEAYALRVERVRRLRALWPTLGKYRTPKAGGSPVFRAELGAGT